MSHAPLSLLAAFGLSAFAVLVPELGHAATLRLQSGASLQTAVNLASPGDTLVLEPGTFTGPVVIDRKLKIIARGARNDTWIIDGLCATATAVTVTADGVKILGRGSFTVKGGTTTQMRVVNAPSFFMKQVRFNDVPLAMCGTEQNGLEIVGGGAKTTLIHVTSMFNANAGMLVDGVVGDARFNAIGNNFLDNGIGVRIQNSGGGSEPGGSGITLKKNVFAQNSGMPLLQLIDSDGVRIIQSDMKPHTPGGIGFQLDAQSDRNVFIGNRLVDPDVLSYDGVTLYDDAGTGNCGKNNDFTLPPCP